jgi:hypothetical protein
MTAVDPNLFDITPSPQDLLEEARVNADALNGSTTGAAAAATAGTATGAESQESPAEVGDDALVDFTAAAQNWFNAEQQDDVPESVISVQSMLSTLVGGMTAEAAQAMATAAGETSPNAALSLTQP